MTDPVTSPSPTSSASLEYLRRVQLVVADKAGGVDLSNLHIQFSIRMWSIETNNVASIRVWNLDDDTSAKIDQEFSDVTLNAGYEGGDFRTIFKGTIVQVRHGWESPADKYCDITAQDGDLAHNYAIVHAALGAGSSIDQRVKVLAQAMGISVAAGGLPDTLPNDAETQLPRGKSMFVKASEELRAQAMLANCTWSIQNGQLQMVPYDGYYPGDVADINAATGMIGWPEQSQEGIQVKTLLNPKLYCNGLIRLNNAQIRQSELDLGRSSYVEQNVPALARPLIGMDGYYRIIVLEHQGDTRGTEYYSSLLCVSCEQKVLPASLISKGYTLV